MYLIDTNVISEVRKGDNANAGVRAFFDRIVSEKNTTYISVITIGEIRAGIEKIRRRNDYRQADLLEKWLEMVLENYMNHILPFDKDAAQVWGYLQVTAYCGSILDKQIAAIALSYDLTIVTRNIRDFVPTGVNLLNPFV